VQHLPQRKDRSGVRKVPREAGAEAQGNDRTGWLANRIKMK
jgi:hypothetical protein